MTNNMKKPIFTAALSVLLVLVICLAAVLLWRPASAPEPTASPIPVSSPDPSDIAPAEPEPSPSADPSPEPTETAQIAPQDPALEALRQSADATGALVAVAYLGDSGEGGIADFLSLDPQALRYRDDFPFLFDLPDSRYVERAAFGSEIYAVVPVDPSATLAVNEWVFDESNDWAGAAGKLLYSGGGDAVILRGNISDILPNLLVTVTDSAGRTLEYSPSLSLRDGSLWTEAGVYDFTRPPSPEVSE